MLRRARHRLATDDGLTLVEVLVALFILGIVLTALASTLITSLRSVVASESRLRGTQLASEVVEDFQAFAWEDLDTYEAYVADRQAAGDFVRGNVSYDADVTVEWVDDPATGASEDYRRLSLMVGWRDLGVDRTLTETAIRAPKPGEEHTISFSLREVEVDPDLGYIRDDGTIAKDGQGNGVGSVTVRAVTTQPLDADSVELSFRERDGTIKTLFMSGSQDNTVWEASGSGNWMFANGDTSFTITANSGTDTAQVVAVARYVHETIVVNDLSAFMESDNDDGTTTREPRDYVCVDGTGAGVEDIVISSEFRGLTGDDVVVLDGANLVAADAVAVESTTDGHIFEHTILTGHQYPDVNEAVITVTGTRGFDGASESGTISLQVRQVGEEGCPA